MVYKEKEMTVFLSSEKIVEKLGELKRKGLFFQEITADKFRIRVESKRRSLFETSVSGIISGKIIRTEDRDVNKIIYRMELPIIFWFCSLHFLVLLFSFFGRLFLALKNGTPPDIKLTLISFFMIICFELLGFAESVSQTNTSEERFLRAFEHVRKTNN